jgi:hypothetical protein
MAVFNEDDVAHEEAIRFSRKIDLPVVLTDFIVFELANALSRRQSRQKFVGLVSCLRSNPACRIIPISKALFDAGFSLYAERPDKDWSLTDCISFVVMNRLRLTEALTADRHFEQAGFKVLLK